MLPVQIEDGGDLWCPYMLNLLFYFPPRRRRRPSSAQGRVGVPLACSSSTVVVIMQSVHGRLVMDSTAGPACVPSYFFFQSEQSAIYRWAQAV